MAAAILAAFPRAADLAQLLRFELSVRLDEIAPSDALGPTVFRVVEWCEARGRLEDLLLGARRANPGNSTLKDLVDASWISPVIPLRSSRWVRDIHSPAALLRADVAEGVPFRGRERERTKFLAWCEKGPRIAVEVLTGGGGMGKTRLARQLCTDLRERDWRAGLLTDEPAWLDDADELRRFFRAPHPTMVVIDYSDRRIEATARVLTVAQSDGGARESNLRFLLLARNAGSWLDDIAARSADAAALLLGPATDWHALDPFADAGDVGARAATFRMACETFAQHLDRAFDATPPADLDTRPHDNILQIHIAALVRVYGESNPPQGRYGLLDYLLARQRGHVEARLEARRQPRDLVGPLLLAMARVTHRGGVAVGDETDALLLSIPELAHAHLHQRAMLAELLYEAYGSHGRIHPVAPDLLGEHLVASEERRARGSVYGGRTRSL